MNKTKGFSLVGILVIVAAVVVLGIVAWRVWDANQDKQSDSTSTNQQTNNQSQNNEPDTEPAAEVDPNEGYVVIEEWGVRFKPVEGLDGVEHFKPSDINADVFTFTTKALSEASADCSPSSDHIVLGLITRNTQTSPASGGVLAQIGDYYYQYRGPESTCGAGNDLETTTVSNLSQSLKSLEAAK